MPLSADKNRLEKFLLPLLCLVFLVLAVFGMGATGDDDSHITYAAARNFVDSGFVTNINGEWVEQGSSLLHVLLLGASYKLASQFADGLSMATVGPLFSLLMGLLCLPMLHRLAGRAGLKDAITPVLLLALSTAFVCWSMGGLESTLATACVLFLVVTTDRYLVEPVTYTTSAWMMLATTCYLLVRPEAFFVLILMLVLVYLLAFMRNRSHPMPWLGRKITAALAGACLIFMLICLVRLYFYGQVFPQPVYAKSGGLSLGKIAEGLFYFVFSMQLTVVIYSASVLDRLRKGILGKEVLPTTVIVATSFAAATLAFIVAAGGDWMTGGRFFVPIMPLLVIVACYSIANSRRYRLIQFCLIVLSVVELTWFGLKFSAGIPLQSYHAFLSRYPQVDWDAYSPLEKSNMVHNRDIPVANVLGRVIAASLPVSGDTLRIASTQMGFIPYHLRQQFGTRIHFVDLRGLVTPDISDCIALAQTPKTYFGMHVSYADFFGVLQQDDCNFVRPDIIFDLLDYAPAEDSLTLETIEREGYHLVYRQAGVFSSQTGMKKVKAGTFIAVSEAVYSRLPEELKNMRTEFR